LPFSLCSSARSLWKIARFLLHAVYTLPTTQDGIYHQRQAILRNTPLAHDTALELLRTSFVWRDRAKKVHYRVLPVASLAAIFSVVSVAAGNPPSVLSWTRLTLIVSLGIFSSKALTSMTNETLISGRNCGAIVDEPFEDSQMESILLYQRQKFLEWFTYATQCYRETDVQQTENCGTFITSTLPYTSVRNASCPFAEEMYKSSTGNLLLDSGTLDSLDHLGWTKGPRFTLRHRSHCAPLNTDDFTETITAPNSSQRFLVYNYGSRDEQWTHQVELDKNSLVPMDYSVGDYKIT